MNLRQEHCVRNAPALAGADIAALLGEVPGWAVEQQGAGQLLRRRFGFPDWHAMFDFATRLSAMVERQDHHPVLVLSYRACDVSFTTDSADAALTRNDFICAARASALHDGKADA